MISGGGMPSDGVPLGFGMALAMNERALTHYAKLTESEKEDLIAKSRDAKTKDEMQRIINRLAADEAGSYRTEGRTDLF